MIDKDGRDWIGYRPYGGAGGKYRGIPNRAHPEGMRRRKSLTLAPARFTIGFAESGVDAEGAIGEIVRDMA